MTETDRQTLISAFDALNTPSMASLRTIQEIVNTEIAEITNRETLARRKVQLPHWQEPDGSIVLRFLVGATASGEEAMDFHLYVEPRLSISLSHWGDAHLPLETRLAALARGLRGFADRIDANLGRGPAPERS